MQYEGEKEVRKRVTKEQCFSILCIIALALTVIPLLLLGHYDYPSADDWSLGLWTRQAVLEGKGFAGVLKAAFRTVLFWRQNGEPRYANAFLGSLQPGIWGEHFYRMTPYIMIGSLIFSELLLGNWLLSRGCKGRCKWICPVLIPSLIIQFLYVPYPVETFYWYVGAINYTFIFSLSLILIYLFLRLADESMERNRVAVFEILGMLLAVLVGGDSYSASLSAVCLFVSCSFVYLFCNKKAFWRTLPITLVTSAGLLVCVTAPGNQVRLNNSFGGSTNGFFQSVWMSVIRTCINIYSWTTLKIVLMVLLILPFLWLALREVSWKFRKPVLFTVFTFGIYAAQITANMYVEGGISACRVADVLYYGYHVWLLMNIGYWIGWLQRRKRFERLVSEKHLLPWFLLTGLMLVGTAGATDLKGTSTYKACAWLLQGRAEEYGAAWEERLAMLHDESLKTVEFEPIGIGEEMIFYADFDSANPWFGEACAEYYNKEYVGLKATGER